MIDLLTWLTRPEHWQGGDGIPVRVGEHLLLSGLGLVLAALVAVPLGVWVGHTNRGARIVINAANLGQAIPAFAILALSLPLAFGLGLGLGFWPTVITLIPLGIPLVLINSYTAVRNVEPDVVEAARGMGMAGLDILRRVELPLASPLIIAGIRNAAVTIVATATLSARIAGGGLGRYIVDGIALQEPGRLLTGALLVALVAIASEIGFGMLARLVVPVALQRTGGR